MGLLKFKMIFKRDTEYVLFQVPEDSANFSSRLFAKMTKTFLLNPARFHVLDFKNVKTFPWQLIPAIETYEKHLNLHKKHLSFLNVSESIKNEIKGLSVEERFNFINSVNELDNSIIVNKLNVRNQKIKKIVNNLFLNAFIEGVSHTLQVQARTPVRALKPFPKSSQKPLFKSEIVSTIDSKSNKFNGSVLLHFNEKRFLKLYNLMMNEKNKIVTPEIAEASSELLNIIYGCAKHALVEIDHVIDRINGIPNLLDEDQIMELLDVDNQSIFLPFQSRAGIFCIEINIEEFFLDGH